MARKIYWLGQKCVEGAAHLPLTEPFYFDFTPDIAGCTAMILTSANGVAALLLSGKTEWQNLSAYCVGEETAKAAKSAGLQVKYVNGGGGAKNLCCEIVKRCKPEKFYYPKAKNAAYNVVSHLATYGFSVKEQIVYETKCRMAEAEIEPGSVLIFSSPSTVECFLAQCSWQVGCVAVALGSSTLKAMPPEWRGIESPKQSAEAAVEFAVTLV